MPKLFINNTNLIFSIALFLLITVIVVTMGKKKNIIILTSSAFAIVLYYVIFKAFKDGMTLNLVVLVRPDLLLQQITPLIQKLFNYRPSKTWSIFGNLSYGSVWRWFKFIVRFELLFTPVQAYYEKMLYIAQTLVKIVCQIFSLDRLAKKNTNHYSYNNLLNYL